MAEKQRVIELILSGKMNSSLSGAFDKAQTGLNRLRRTMTGVTDSERHMRAGSKMMAGSLVKSALGYAAAYVGVRELATGVWDFVKAANESNREQTRMSQLMSNVKGTTLAQIKATKDYATAIMNKTTLDDETIMRGQGQLATFQLQAKSIRKLTPAMADLAVGTFGLNANSENLQKTGNLLGKVFTGQVGALRKVGISFDKNQEKMLKNGNEAQKTAMLIKVINQNYGGLAKKMADTDEGKIARMAVAWGNVKENIGGALSPTVTKVLGYISRNLPGIQAFLTRIVGGAKQGVSVLKPFYNYIATQVWPMLKSIGGEMIAIFREAWPAIQPVLTKLGGSVKRLLTEIVPTVRTIWETIKPTFKWFIGTALPIALDIIGKIVGQVALLVKHLRAAVDWWNSLTDTYRRDDNRTNYVSDARDKMIQKQRARNAKLISEGKQPLPIRVPGLGVGAGMETISARAGGGPVRRGRSYLVGERGPELFRPRSSGSIVPNGRLAAAGGMTLNYSPSFSISGNADGAVIDGALQMSERRLEAMLEKIEAKRNRRKF